MDYSTLEVHRCKTTCAQNDRKFTTSANVHSELCVNSQTQCNIRIQHSLIEKKSTIHSSHAHGANMESTQASETSGHTRSENIRPHKETRHAVAKCPAARGRPMQQGQSAHKARLNANVSAEPRTCIGRSAPEPQPAEAVRESRSDPCGGRAIAQERWQRSGYACRHCSERTRLRGQSAD